MSRYKDRSGESVKCEDCIHNDKQWYELPCDACCPAHSGYESLYRLWNYKAHNEEREGRRMSRYIDAYKIEYEDMLYSRGDGNYEECQIAYRDQIDDIPTADVVEVVRCKDCKHRDTNECPYDTVNYMLAGWDFCSSGEKADE